MVLYFSTVATFILLFTYHTGCLLRGGICIGKSYRNTFDSDLLDGDLIFSEAFVRSYLLESTAIYPRVLIDDHLLSLWNEKTHIGKNRDFVESLIKQDTDGEYYINFYQVLYRHAPETVKQWLEGIAKRIKEMLKEKQDQKGVWRKWHWFKEYHNLKIRGFIKDSGQDLSELII